MRASRFRSGPTAKGTTVTRQRKKTTPVAPPPPMRRASARSRRNRAQSAALIRAEAPVRRSSPIGPCVAATIRPPRPRCSRMRSASTVCEAASSAVAGSSSSQSGPRRDQEPRDRDPPPLPGREIAAGQVGGVGRARRGRAPRPASPIRRPRVRAAGLTKARLSSGVSGGLQRVGMAEIMGALAERRASGIVGLGRVERAT